MARKMTGILREAKEYTSRRRLAAISDNKIQIKCSCIAVERVTYISPELPVNL